MKFYLVTSDRLPKMFFIREDVDEVAEAMRGLLSIDDYIYFTEDPSYSVREIKNLGEFFDYCPPDFVMSRPCP